MKIALLQCNNATGDVAGNAERILAAVREAAAQGADLCVTPELALCGVAPGSYLRAEDFAEGCKAGLQMLADALQDGPPLLVGAPVASVYASGLLSNAGIGLLVLFRSNSNMKENITIVAISCALSAMVGVVIGLIF